MRVSQTLGRVTRMAASLDGPTLPATQTKPKRLRGAPLGIGLLPGLIQ